MIIPAILEKDWSSIESKINTCKDFANTLHIDFIDGKFVDNTSFLEFEPFKKYSSNFTLEAHLMVEEPIKYLDRLASAGFRRFLGHVEKMSDQVEFVVKGQELGFVGLALDLETSTDVIMVNLEDLDQILLMSVKAGKSGQEFSDSVLPKIESLKSLDFRNIEIDGGINSQTIVLAKNAGANIFCATSYLFNEDPKINFRKLQELL